MFGGDSKGLASGSGGAFDRDTPDSASAASSPDSAGNVLPTTLTIPASCQELLGGGAPPMAPVKLGALAPKKIILKPYTGYAK
jgi:hypothetical protein